MNTEKGTAPTGANESGPPEMNRKQRRQMAHLAKKYRPRGKCPFPGCGHTFFQEDGQPNACPDHRKLIADVLYIVNHTKTGEPEAVGGKDGKPTIYVPKPGVSMRTLEIELAAEAAKGGNKP